MSYGPNSHVANPLLDNRSVLRPNVRVVPLRSLLFGEKRIVNATIPRSRPRAGTRNNRTPGPTQAVPPDVAFTRQPTPRQ